MAFIKQIIEESPFHQQCSLVEEFNEQTIYFSQPQKINNFLLFLYKCTVPFQMLIDICGVHYPANSQPFEVVYHLLSLTHNQRIRVIVRLNEGDEVHTVDNIYNAACWFERETYDMYGIVFTNSKDSRRILTDYNFKGFPLRKDFPLTGEVEVRYDQSSNEVVYEPVTLPQDYRQFDFKSNWVGQK